jgi:hypothetical protein
MNLVSRLAALTILLLAAQAGRTAEIDWLVAPYVWAADTSLDLSINGDPALGATLPFSDLIDKLDNAFMLHIEGRPSSSDIGGFFDILSMTISDNSVTPVGPGGPILGDLDVATKLSMGLYEAGAVLSFGDTSYDKTVLEILLGMRYVDVDQTLNITLPGPVATVIDRRISVSEIDLLVGARVMGKFTDRLGYKLRADYANFGTDGTLNLLASVGYTFGQTGLFSIDLGYRHMTMDLSDNLGIGVSSESEVKLSGPTVGFLFRF